MNERIERKRKFYVSLNVFIFIWALMFLLVSFGSSGDFKFMLRVFFRGLLGLLILYNSMYLLLTNQWSFLTIKASKKERLIGGIVLGITGLICVITSLLGYGLNGDPRVMLWK